MMESRSSQQAEFAPAVHELLLEPATTRVALEAMRSFIAQGDEAVFERAIALYVKAAKKRREPIETVLGVLCTLATDLEGPRVAGEVLMRPTPMHGLIFAGILRAFFGNVAVERGIGASSQRKADAPDHVKTGTWPRTPAG
jgi:hypothetical protein